MTPKFKPQMSQADVDAILAKFKIDRKKYPVVLLGIRGYYLDTIGVKGVNDRGHYDDSFFWSTPRGMTSFNGNCDPSAVRKGSGKGVGKGMANLKKGLWLYQTGIHNGSVPHPAFRQAAPVTVIRDGLADDYEDTGMFGINIHRGGSVGTSSLGCQTVPPDQWPAFKELGYLALAQNNQKIFPYVLVEETDLRAAKASTPKNTATNLTPAIELIKEFEGFRSKAYTDTGGVWTIGYGTTKGVREGMVVTEEKARELLTQYIDQRCIPHIYACIKVPLTNNQLCALISFTYNLGDVLDTANFAKKLNLKDYKGAADGMLAWNKDNGRVLPGLVKRREIERALFLKT